MSADLLAIQERVNRAAYAELYEETDSLLEIGYRPGLGYFMGRKVA